MIYRDVPQDFPMQLKEVVLPVKLFQEVAAYAHIGEAVLNMRQGMLLTFNEGKYYCTAADANILFFSENPLEALDAYLEWADNNGEASNNPS